MTAKWDTRFLALAALVASWSKDPSTKVGAVITRPDNTLASVGYNGFPRGVDDSPARYADREIKYPCTVHAERNAILHAREPLQGYSLYVHPLMPCATCAGEIIQAGITHVITVSEYPSPAHWADSFDITQQMFTEAGVDLRRLEATL